ncbi:unnamed protein product [Penicillium bialowiezense]
MVCIRSFCILGLASLGAASVIARDVSRVTDDVEATPSGPSRGAYCWADPIAGIQDYSVQYGDTCWDIIARFNNKFTISELLCWNSEINPTCSNLIPGRTLCVAVGATAPVC